ncbi:MAG: hypothetical protein J5684_06430 [Eubacterium sp.]|nr:hypothetical protein [Eubacterium sp.]
MSNYVPLWEYVQNDGREAFEMTYDEIKSTTGIDVDASIIRYKGEIKDYGYVIFKISAGTRTISFKKHD